MIEQGHSDAVIVCRVRRLMCVFTGLLVASTWPLWTPGPQFPDIPWLEWFCPVAESWFDWMPLGAAAILLTLEFRGLPPGLARTWIVRSVLASPVLFALLVDQHRLQPWVWQMLLMGMVLRIPQEPTALRCLRWLTVSIYAHSALSKIDVAFVEGPGQWLLDGLASSLGFSTVLWGEATRHLVAAVFPLGELGTALLLVWPRTRRIGLTLAIVMHGMLLLALGPLGHGQQPAVLIWNVFFILLVVELFGRRGEHSGSAGASPSHVFRDRVAVTLTGLIMLLPCLSWWGYWDHWPSWAVYSARPAVVQMFVPEGKVDDLPESLQPFVGPPEPLGDLCPVNLDAWSFETLWCPVYPQERYRIAVAAALGAGHDLQRMRVVIHSSPNRWTGTRRTTVLDGKEAVLKRAFESDRYLLNTRPREPVPSLPNPPEN